MAIQEGRPHPAVFPIKLPERCINLHGIKPNLLVYDPFMGIGNTALACLRLGLNYLGTEIDAEYIKIAQHKMASALLETIYQWTAMKSFRDLQLLLVLSFRYEFLTLVSKPTSTIKRMQTFIYLNLCLTNIS